MIPLSVVLPALFNLGMNFVVVLVFALASGVEPRWSWLELPLLVALVCRRSPSGVAMLLSALYVRFRDIQPIWDVVAQILFYALADHLRRAPYARRAASVSSISP